MAEKVFTIGDELERHEITQVHIAAKVRDQSIFYGFIDFPAIVICKNTSFRFEFRLVKMMIEGRQVFQAEKQNV